MRPGLEGEGQGGEEELRGPRVARGVRPWRLLRGMEEGGMGDGGPQGDPGGVSTVDRISG